MLVWHCQVLKESNRRTIVLCWTGRACEVCQQCKSRTPTIEDNVHFFADRIALGWPECAHPRGLTFASRDDETRRKLSAPDGLYRELWGVGCLPYRNQHHQIHPALLQQKTRRHQCLELQIRVGDFLMAPVRIRRQWGWQLRTGQIHCRMEHRRS
jgi:hypothetical protein